MVSRAQKRSENLYSQLDMVAWGQAFIVSSTFLTQETSSAIIMRRVCLKQVDQSWMTEATGWQPSSRVDLKSVSLILPCRAACGRKYFSMPTHGLEEALNNLELT